MKNIFFILFLLFTSISFSQEMKFTGFVNDTIQNKPIENAVIMAVRLSDKKLLGFTRSKADGSFTLTGVPIDTLEIVVSHYDFDQKSYYIIGSEENKEINIRNVVLPKEAQELEEVVIFANKKPMYFRGDTLVYVADSFAVKENAMVEDLLKNLPGLQVDDDGKITSQGQEITKVLVDGDEFFGTDPTIATRNLQADGVKEVEVYEKEDEDAGGNSEEKIKVLDVKLKDDAKNGYFGKVAGSGGFNSEYFRDQPNGMLFYEGEFLFNYFNKDLKISVFGLGANTSNSGFSHSDASRFGLTNEFSGGWQSRFGGSALNGIPQNYKGGFYYTDKLGEKVKVNLNYTYNDSRLTTDQNTESQYFFADTSYQKNDSLYKEQKDLTHTINFGVEYDLNDKTKLELKTNLILRKEEIEEQNSSQFRNTDEQVFSKNNVKNVTNADGLEGNVELKLNRKFDKRFRELDASYQFGYTDNNRENTLNTDLYFTQLVTPDSTLDQKREIKNQTTGHRVLIDYQEPLTRQFRLKFQYRLDYFYGDQETSTYNRTPSGYDEYADLYSNYFNNTRLENRGSAGIFFTNRTQEIEAGARIRNVVIDNLNTVSNKNIHQDVNNVLPYLRYKYKFSNSHRITFRYSTRSSQPSLNQLQPVRNNTNPNSIVIGNPNLTPSYTHSLRLSYNKWNSLKGSYYFLSSNFSYTENAFSNSIAYLPDGRSISKGINVDGNMNGSLYAGMGVPIFKKLITVRPFLMGNYFNNKSIINNQDNTTENYGATGSLKLSSRSDSIEVSISASYTYNYPISSSSAGINEPYSVQRYKVSVFYELPFRFFIESDATYQINSRRADGFNITPFIWDATLNRRFLKTGNLTASVSVYDIFNQHVGISRNVGTNIITDTRSRIIARYFMVGLTLRFNNNNKKVEDDKGYF